METWRAKPLGARGAYDMRVLKQVPAYARARAWAHVPHSVQEVGVGWRTLYGSDSPGGVWQGGRVLEEQAAVCFSLRRGHGNR
jgi:hypothetical protein